MEGLRVKDDFHAASILALDTGKLTFSRDTSAMKTWQRVRALTVLTSGLPKRGQYGTTCLLRGWGPLKGSACNGAESRNTACVGGSWSSPKKIDSY